MSLEPPAWANSPNCAGCKTGFSLFNRKHHCRACGQTFCGNCSSFNIPLPHFGITEPARVCAECYQKEARAQKQSGAPARSDLPTNPGRASPVEDEPAPAPAPAPVVKNCTCGMPLCVCPPDPVEEKKLDAPRATPVKKKSVSSTTRPKVSGGPSSMFSGFSSEPTAHKYDLKGDLDEQCRDAIKNKDVDGVKQLLEAKADANYADRTGNSLLHLGAIFNRLDIVKLLCQHGAKMTVTNPSGETPIDVAPPSLAHKMKQL